MNHHGLPHLGNPHWCPWNKCNCPVLSFPVCCLVVLLPLSTRCPQTIPLTLHLQPATSSFPSPVLVYRPHCNSFPDPSLPIYTSSSPLFPCWFFVFCHVPYSLMLHNCSVFVLSVHRTEIFSCCIKELLVTSRKSKSIHFFLKNEKRLKRDYWFSKPWYNLGALPGT